MDGDDPGVKLASAVAQQLSVAADDLCEFAECCGLEVYMLRSISGDRLIYLIDSSSGSVIAAFTKQGMIPAGVVRQVYSALRDAGYLGDHPQDGEVTDPKGDE